MSMVNEDDAPNKIKHLNEALRLAKDKINELEKK